MKRLALTLSLLAMAAVAGEWKGTISDAKCGKAHADASEKSKKCVVACVKAGIAPVFVTEDGKVLKIHNAEKVNDQLGHRVTLTGKLDGDTVQVEEVRMNP